MSWIRNFFTGPKPPPKEAGDPGAARDIPGAADAILPELKAFLAGLMDPKTGVAPGAIPDDAHVLDGGYIDSVTAADFLLHLGARYGVRLSEVDLAGGLGQLSKLASHLAKERHP